VTCRTRCAHAPALYALAMINYVAKTGERPRYYANDHSRDVLVIDPKPMAILDARDRQTTLDAEGFTLVQHRSNIADFTDAQSVWAIHRAEIATLIQNLCGADSVEVNAPGVLRFSEQSDQAGALNNSMPARFAHVDITDKTALDFATRTVTNRKAIRRFAHFNVWRAISPPPQDVPLAVCDARSVSADDLIAADAIFDERDKPEWSFEGWVVAHNPAHRWYWFSDMSRDEVLVFKTNDSDPQFAHCVPHVAFDDPLCPKEAPPRASIEMRALALWFD
jgi:hypothetical protein